MRERARRVHGDDADRPAELADVADESADETRLPHSGRPGDAHDGGLPGVGIDLADERIREWIAVLDERDRTRERATIGRSARPRRAPRASSSSRATERTLCSVTRADAASAARRASISSRSVAMRSSGGAGNAVRNRLRLDARSWPLTSDATADSELASTALPLVLLSDRQPAGHDERDERTREVETTGGDPDGSRAERCRRGRPRPPSRGPAPRSSSS